MFSPTPWRYESVGECAKTGEDFGNIFGVDGVIVAENVYEKDAAAIISIVNEKQS